MNIKNLFTIFFTAFLAVFTITCCKTTPDSVVSVGAKKTPQVIFAEKLQKILENGSVEDALLLFEEMPEKLKNDYKMNVLHASLLVSAGHLEQAEVVVDKLQNIKQNGLDALVIGVMIAKSRGDNRKKTALLKQILAIDPKNTDAYVELANDQMFRKKYKLAGAYYLKAFESDRKNTNAIMGYGQCAYYQGKFDEAKRAFNNVIELQPKNSMAWSYLAKLDAENENYSAASENIKKAIEYDNLYQDYWIDYGRYLYFQGKFKAAEEAWNKAESIDENNFLLYVYRSNFYDQQNRYPEAIKDYKALIRVKPEYFYAYEALGILYWHEEKWEEARQYFQKAYELNPKNISYALMVSSCYMMEKKEKENRKFMSLVLKNRDINSNEYNILRLYYDGVNPYGVGDKVSKENNSSLRGKYLFYVGQYLDLNGDDINAKKYYADVTKMQSPMFFEYRIAEWRLKKIGS
ncbi:MAG: tetratricopeptide repeat protein [Treponemataceae bacterium]